MRILIVKTSSLGDIIQSFPVLVFLYQTFPSAKIDWIVEKSYEDLLAAHPNISRVIPIEIRKRKKNRFKYWSEIKKTLHSLRDEYYDLLIDLQGNIKSGIITKHIRSKEKIGMTFSSAPEWPNALFLTHRYPLNKKESIYLQYLSLVQNHFGMHIQLMQRDLFLNASKKEEERLLSILKGEKKIMVCPGSRWENKKLFVSTWIEVLKKERSCHFYFVWGSEKEKEEAMILHSHFSISSTLLPKTSLPILQRVMSEMDLIYTVDSGALHLAATTNTPTYSFFGPSMSEIYKPIGKRHQAFQASCPYGKTFVKRCPVLRTCKTGACLKDLSKKDFF